MRQNERSAARYMLAWHPSIEGAGLLAVDRADWPAVSAARRAQIDYFRRHAHAGEPVASKSSVLGCLKVVMFFWRSRLKRKEGVTLIQESNQRRALSCVKA